MTPKVFISTATAGTPQQDEAKATICEWSYQQPLKAIRKVIGECHGVAVLAFAKSSFPSGMELTKKGQEPRTDVRLPTVWNQIEAAMGYSRGLPLLIIAENGLREEGLLEQYDWTVFWTSLDPAEFRSEKFGQWIASWREDVVKHASLDTARENGELDVSKITIGQLLRRSTIPQLWALASAFVGLLGAIATLSYRLGASKWPWQ